MLDAAEQLVRQSGGTDFSMRILASTAEVSPATPYNVFGSKEGLLFELLNRHLAIIIERGLELSSRDPLEQIIEAAESAVDVILEDPAYLRPLYHVLLGLVDPMHHPKFLKDAFVFYRTAVNGALEHELIANEQDAHSLACSLMAQFLGLLDLWVHEDIDGEWFRAQLVYGFIHQVWPLARGPRVKRLQKRLATVRKTLAKKQLQPAFVG